MRVTIAGGHGQIALHLERQLSKAGHEAVGMIRKPEQAADVEAAGASTVMLDLEDTDLDAMTAAVEGSDAVVFAAGGGGDGSKERKETVDKGAAVMLADAAKQAGVTRYLMVSAMGTDQIDPDSDEVFQVYLRAKLAADEYVQGTDLAWTIVRPGKLTDDPGTGLVQAGSLPYGEIPRADVAAVLVAALDSTKTVGKTFDLTGGDDEIDEALRKL